jgi:ribosomal protein L37AE/L43A
MNEQEHLCQRCNAPATIGVSAGKVSAWFCNKCFDKVAKEISSGARREKQRREKP